MDCHRVASLKTKTKAPTEDGHIGRLGGGSMIKLLRILISSLL